MFSLLFNTNLIWLFALLAEVSGRQETGLVWKRPTVTSRGFCQGEKEVQCKAYTARQHFSDFDVDGIEMQIMVQ